MISYFGSLFNRIQGIKGRIDKYESLYTSGSDDDRKKNYMNQVNTYYDLVTPFYEYAWGQHFHFVPQFDGESIENAIARYEHSVALKIRAGKGMRILDVGCGIGGPARTIAQFSGAHVVGVNNNAYQIERARLHTDNSGLSDLVSFVQCDFHDLEKMFEPNSFDAVFSIEAIVHSPRKFEVYKSIYKILKPGGYFVTAEWALTDKYDPKNPHHNLWVHKIEVGDGLPPLERDIDILEQFKKSGFKLIEVEDISKTSSKLTRWYHSLEFNFSLRGLLQSRLGHYITHFMLTCLEYMKVADPGSVDVSRILMEAADGLVGAGKAEIFTPMYIIWGQKIESD